LGNAAAEAGWVFDAAIADVVDRYETEGPASLAVDTVVLRRRLDSLMDGRPTISQRQRLLGLAGRASALLAYMAVNLGRFTWADADNVEAYAFGCEAGDPALMAWVRGTPSFSAYYRHDYATVQYARDGLRLAGDGPQALRLTVNCVARALAYLPGHQREAQDAVNDAYWLADRLDVPQGLTPCISFGPYGRDRITANAITAFQTLGRTDEAVDLVEQISSTLDKSASAWSRSLVNIDHATTLLQRPDPDVEQAMHLASAAIVVSADTPIASILQRGQALAAAAARFSDLPSVREFHHRVHTLAHPEAADDGH
jgi:hypothetical protein